MTKFSKAGPLAHSSLLHLSLSAFQICHIKGKAQTAHQPHTMSYNFPLCMVQSSSRPLSPCSLALIFLREKKKVFPFMRENCDRQQVDRFLWKLPRNTYLGLSTVVSGSSQSAETDLHKAASAHAG